MSYDYIPNRSYGPLIFGMSPPDVEAILGKPKSFKSPFEGIPIDAEMKAYVDDLRIMEFDPTHWDHTFPQITFDREKVVAFTLLDIKSPFVYDGINAFDKDRSGILSYFARSEDIYYFNDEYYFFPKAGLQIPDKKYARKLPYITLVDSTYEMKRLDYNFLERSTNLG